MAVAVTPKSEFRRNHNIIEGYGEVPAVEVDGVIGWGLPGGVITFSESEAREYAKRLDKALRHRVKHPNQLVIAA